MQTIDEYDAFTLPGLTVAVEEGTTGTSKFDLLFSFTEASADGAADGIDGVVEFATDVFDARTVRSLADRLLVLLKAVVAQPDRRVADADLFTPGSATGCSRSGTTRRRRRPVTGCPRRSSGRSRGPRRPSQCWTAMSR